MALVVLETYQNGVSWSEKGYLSLLGLISSIISVIQQTYLLLDQIIRHARARLILVAAIFAMNIIIAHHLRFSVNAANTES